VFLAFGLTAVARLRAAVPWAKPEPAADPPTGLKKRQSAADLRPPVGDRPVVWWELYGGRSRRELQLARWFTPRRFVWIGVVTFAALLGARAADPYWVYGPDRLARAAQMALTIALWVFAWILILSPAFVAVRGVAKERAADTLDGLLLTALTPEDILAEKWLGAVAAGTGLYVLMLTLAAAGVLAGFVHPFGFVGLAVSVPVFAGSTAAIGLLFSVWCTTPAKAMRNMTLICGGALYVFGSVAGMFTGLLRSPIPALAAFPPAAAGVGLVLGFDERGEVTAWDLIQGALGVVGGMAVYGAVGWLAWRTAVARFDRERHD
jgi:ABC-type transport system involved in multi-copper enzyme maturation permease subunit